MSIVALLIDTSISLCDTNEPRFTTRKKIIIVVKDT